MENHKIKLPEFELKCKLHKKNKIAYCMKCKINICKLCLENHGIKEHNIIPFSKIKFPTEEILELKNLINEINSNINNLIQIKEEIENLINQLTNSKGISEVFENNSENNFIKYYINILKIIKENTKINENFQILNINEDKELFEEKIQLTQCNLKKIKTLKPHFDWIFCLLSFPSGNLISVSCDQSIIIYNSNLNIIQNINFAHNEPLTCLSIKDDNNFITCSNEGTIKIWNKKTGKFILKEIISNAHSDSINKIIYCSNNDIISCSDDQTIKIWRENKNKSYQNLISFSHNSTISSILFLEDENLLISCGKEETKFYELLNYKNIKTLNSKCGSWGSLEKLDNNRIITGGGNDSIMKIISIQNKEIIKDVNNFFVCWAICIYENKGIFLTGGMSRNINIFRIDNYELINTIHNCHDGPICGITLTKNRKIISYSQDQLLKEWEIN